MSPRRLPLDPLAAGAALGALLLAVAWLLFRGGLQVPEPAATSRGVAPPPAHGPNPAAVLAAPEPPPALPGGADGSGRARALSAAERELEAAIWVAGVVVLPLETPADERAFVVSRGSGFQHAPQPRAALGPGGTFRVAFAPGTTTGTLDIEARYLYLEEPMGVALADLRAPVSIEPKLGGRIVAVFQPPEPGAEVARRLAGAPVRLNLSFTLRLGQDSAGMLPPDAGLRSLQRRSGALGEDLSVEFRQLLPDLSYGVLLEAEGFVPARSDTPTVSPGATTLVEVHLEPEIRLAGRVVDPLGAPVPLARVGTEIIRSRAVGVDVSSQTAQADSEGRFAFAGVRSGKIELRAEVDDFAPGVLALGELAPGETRDDLEIELRRGETILGRVQWPDGRPEAGVVVQLGEEDPAATGPFPDSRLLERNTDAEGGFRFAGIGPGPYTLRAQARQGTGAGVGPLGKVVRSGVMPADSPLVLVLATPTVLAGRVVDDAGSPVTAFELTATPQGRRDLVQGRMDQKTRGRFRDLQGRFRIENLTDGVWEIVVHAKRHFLQRPVTVELPWDGRELEIVLPRAASLRGKVLEPGGLPAAGAEVRLESTVVGAEMQRGATMIGPGLLQRVERTVRADVDGSFALEGVPSGAAWLTAASPGWAPSEGLDLDLAPAQELEGVLLRLQRASRITGEIRAEEPLARRVVLGPPLVGVVLFHGSESRSTESGSDGRFAFEGVPPGRYEVVAEPPVPPEGLGGFDWLSRRLVAEVEVSEGEDAHVVLGEASPSAVLLHGMVRRAGSPVEGAQVTAMREGRMWSAVTGLDGRYEIGLEGPGGYGVGWAGPRGSTLRRREVQVPDAERFSLDLELPSGSISGRVTFTGGEPDEAYVTLEETSLPEPVGGYEDTADGGRFRFEDLPAGSYVLSASPASAAARDPDLAVPRLRVDLGEGQSIDGLELRFERGAVIEGRVLASAGQPAVGVQVRLRGEDGARSRTLPSVATDARGRYRLASLPAGRWRVSATSDSEASAASDPVDLAPGSRAEVDLHLRPATSLIAIVERPDGTPVFPRVYAVDGPGWSALVRAGPWTSDPAEGIVIALLPPGTWRIAAELEGLRAEQSVALSGESERTVRLRLGD